MRLTIPDATRTVHNAKLAARYFRNKTVSEVWILLHFHKMRQERHCSGMILATRARTA